VKLCTVVLFLLRKLEDALPLPAYEGMEVFERTGLVQLQFRSREHYEKSDGFTGTEKENLFSMMGLHFDHGIRVCYY